MIFLFHLDFLKRIRDNREAKRNFRTIYINNVKPANVPDNIEEPLKYKKNDIVTSKVKAADEHSLNFDHSNNSFFDFISTHC